MNRWIAQTAAAALALGLATAAVAAVSEPSSAAPAAEARAVENIDPQAIGRAVAEIEEALRSGELVRSKTLIDELAAQLPPQSLTLLRMQAWHAHQSGDRAGAMALYAEIVQRVPADRYAAINLALLEAEQGDVDGASQRLRALRFSGGDSAELAAAMALVGATRP